MQKINGLKTIHIDCLQDLPAEAGRLADFLRAQQVKSLIVVPIIQGQEAVGFLGFDAVRQEKTWTADLVALLQQVAKILANALERQGAEEALRASERYQRAIVEALPDLIFTLDKNGVYLDYRLDAEHPEVTDFLGKNIAELDMIPKEVAAEIKRKIRLTLQRDQVQTVEYVLPWPKENSHYEARLSSIDQRRVLMLVRDITANKQIQQSLRRSAEFQKSLVDLVGELLHREITPDFYQYLLESAVKLIPGAQAGSILLNGDDERYHFVAAVSYDLKTLKTISFSEAELLFGKGGTGQASYLVKNLAEVNKNTLDSKRNANLQKAGSTEKIKVALAVPIHLFGKVAALLSLDSMSSEDAFDQEARQMAEAFGAEVGVVLQRLQLQAEAESSEQRFRLLAENMSDLVCLHDAQGRYVYLSPSSKNLLGYAPEDLLGKTLYELIHPEDVMSVRIELDLPVSDVQASQLINYRIRKSSGDYIWFETFAQPIFDEQGQLVNLVTSSRDITDRKQVEDQLLHGALHDALTNLPNRVLFMDRLEQAIKHRHRDPAVTFAVLFLDLDRFKVINDSLGHSIGDQLLIELAKRLQRSVRESDTIARLGGDEFAILLDEISSEDDAQRAAERIQKSLSQPFIIAGHEVFTTASIGIALGSSGTREPHELLRDADIAMYRAKALGATHSVFDNSMHEIAVKRLEIENYLRRALQNHEFKLHYQPIVNLADGGLAGFEALLCWQQPERGMVSPAEFLPVAEETGLIIEIGDWVLHEACRQMADWERRFPTVANLSVSVNLSATQFMVGNLAQQIVGIIAKMGLSVERLKLEITESTIMASTDLAAQVLAELRVKGVKVLLDDFGTGYSSLSYLHRFPLDTLKIDRSFIRHMGIKQHNTEIVQTIIALARNLKLDVIAEGVENSAQLKQLKDLACDFAQGYLFAPALSADEAETWLKEQVRPKCSLG